MLLSAVSPRTDGNILAYYETDVRAYHGIENLPYSGCYFSGPCVCSDWGEFSVKEAFYVQLQMVMVSCSKWDILIVLGDFNATTCTGRDGYQSSVVVHGSGSRDGSSSVLLDFAKSRRLSIAVS